MWKGSAWTVDQINGLYINTSNYEPLSGSSYIQLPEKLRHHMKCLINIENKDYKCFCRVMLDLLILQIVIQKE